MYVEQMFFWISHDASLPDIYCSACLSKFLSTPLASDVQMSTAALVERSVHAPLEAGIIVQRVTKEFLDLYVQLHAEILPVQYPPSWYEMFFLDEDRIALVAVDSTLPIKESIVGFATGRVAKGGRNVSSWESCWKVCMECFFVQEPSISMIGYIMSLGCRPSHRRRGIANLLLQVLICELERLGATGMSLHCTIDNKSAIHLYRKHGFAVRAQLREYYHFHGCYHDAFHMMRKSSKAKSSSILNIMEHEARKYRTKGEKII